jgi:hypothetical protein
MSRRTRLEVARLEDRDVPATAIAGIIAVGSGPGTESQVQVYDAQSGALKFTFDPFPGFAGGVSVASGNITGDAVPDIVVGAGPGGGPEVRIFDGTNGNQLATIMAYEDTFRGGVNVSVADFNKDGRADIAIGTGVGGGPRVRIISGATLKPLRDVLVYEPSFRGGVNVAVGDINGDGIADIATSTGAGGGPRVVVFNGANLAPIASFFAFDPSSRNGFNIAVGDVNADGRADIVTGAGAGDPGQVKVFSGKNLAVLASFFVTNSFNSLGGIPYISGDAGIRVAVSDVNGDLIGDVVTAKGPGSEPRLRMYQITSVNKVTNALVPTLQEIREQDVFNTNYGFGIALGASDNTGNPLA